MLYFFYILEEIVFIFIIGLIMNYIDYILCINIKKYEGINFYNKGLVLFMIYLYKVLWIYGNFWCNCVYMSIGYDYY